MIEAWNPYKSWTRKHLTTNRDLKEMVDLFHKDFAPPRVPLIGGGDTETTGLHIKKDKPFLIIFGWLVPGEKNGRVFTFKPTPKTMEIFFSLAEKLKVFMWWNTKYDLHMMTNDGYVYDKPNLLEGIALARLVVQAIPTRAGGDSMQLKHIGKSYVHPEAADAEKVIGEIKKTIQARRVKILSAALKQFDHPWESERKAFRKDTGKTTTGKYASDNPENVEWKTIPKKWTKGLIEDFLKDKTNEPEDLPEDVREMYQDWLDEYGGDYEATYKDIYDEAPEEMIKYAGDDVITMLEFFKVAVPVLKERQQERTLKRENDLILPLYRMERIGIKVDREYLTESKHKLKKLIKQKRKQMWEIAGQTFAIGQHELIKKIFNDKWNIPLEKDDKKALKDVSRNHKGTPADELSKLIRSLRRLEKWYSTYCLRILKITEYDGRFYTQIAQASAVSGRVGSDGQQFPKERILTEEGEKYEEENGENTAPKEYEVFYPRRAFVPTDRGNEHGYTGIYYLDFSQIELRNQADYTIRVSGGDLNMCRAYMPFKCQHYLTGAYYNYKDPEYRKFWNLKQDDGVTSAWIMEDGTPWTPTDVHSETTHNALIELGYDCITKYKEYAPSAGMPERNMIFGKHLNEKAFKLARYKGKIFNFMKNYGGGMRAAMEQLDLPEVAAKALIRGYEVAFPHVVIYQDKIVYKHGVNGYVKNMYDRRYYLDDNNKAYKLANYCVQGTCADMLKECIIEIDKFLADYKTRFIMNIHDELQFEVWQGEEYLIPQILQIMQGHDWHMVPIVSDVEVAKDNWADKIEYKIV